MTFSKEVLDKFEEIWREGKTLTISGVNGMGQEFTTCGRISITKKGEGAFGSNYVYLQFGAKNASEKPKCIASFLTKLGEDSLNRINLFAFEIKDENGNLIFSNEDKDSILKEIELIKEQMDKQNQSIGLFISENDKLDPVTKEFMGMVGKPFKLEGEDGKVAGVLIGVDRYTNRGKTLFWYYHGADEEMGYVDSKSVLKTEDLNGEETILAENTPSNSREVFDFRKRMAEDASHNSLEISY